MSVLPEFTNICCSGFGLINLKVFIYVEDFIIFLMTSVFNLFIIIADSCFFLSNHLSVFCATKIEMGKKPNRFEGAHASWQSWKYSGARINFDNLTNRSWWASWWQIAWNCDHILSLGRECMSYVKIKLKSFHVKTIISLEYSGTGNYIGQ